MDWRKRQKMLSYGIYTCYCISAMFYFINLITGTFTYSDIVTRPEPMPLMKRFTIKEISHDRNEESNWDFELPDAHIKAAEIQLQSRNTTNTKSQGFILPYRLYEQQTAAARNLWGLQYWANFVGMKVVEPFYNNYGMSFIPIVNGIRDPLRFSDLYDRDFWNIQSMKRNCSELVTWEEFLANAPKKTILVLLSSHKPKHAHVANTSTVSVVSNPETVNGSWMCDHNAFPIDALKYFSKQNFNFVRGVCVIFSPTSPMTMEEFTTSILGHESPNDVTIVIAQWKGIRRSRVNLQVQELTNDNTVTVGLLPSKWIVEQSDMYLQKLKLRGEKYFGVMIRVEKVFVHYVTYHDYNPDKFHKYMMNCARSLNDLKAVQSHKNWGRTFAIDLGKLGSLYFQGEKMTENMEQLYATFFTSVLGNHGWSIKEYENSFAKYINVSDPVHIAQIQRTIMARSDCLIVVGGASTFQQVAISFYKNFHPNVAEQCIIKHCYYGKNFYLNDQA